MNRLPKISKKIPANDSSPEIQIAQCPGMNSEKLYW
jgi:hypothetical protein